MANVAPVTPNANLQNANAPAAPAGGIDAMFAALLADAAPQADGANIAMPLPAGIPQTPQNNNAPAAPVNIVLPMMPAQSADAPSVSANAPVLANAPAPADPAIAFAATPPQQGTPAEDSKDAKTDPAAIQPMQLIPNVAINMAAPAPQAPISNIQIAQSEAAPTTADVIADLPAANAAPAQPPTKPASKDPAKNNPVQIPVVAPTAFAPLPQTAPMQTADIAIGDAASAPKSAQPALQPVQQKEAQNTDALATQPKPDAAVINTASQGDTKPAPAPQSTQSQASPLQFDLTLNSNGGQTNSGHSQSQSQQQPAPQIQPAQAPALAAAPVQTSQTNSSNSDPQSNSVPSAPPALSALAIAAPATPVHVNTAIQVSAPSSSASVPYDSGAIAVAIAAKSDGTDHHFDIRLDPPELGSIAVHLSIDHTGQASAHLTADKPETLQLLQNDSTNLQSALKDAGVNLANSGLNFSLRGDQRQAGQSFQRSNSRTRNLSVSAAPSFNSASSSSFVSGSTAVDITV